MRAGFGVAEFWDLTPHETFAAIDARIWRDEQQQKQAISQAWLMASLSRRKRLPALSSLLTGGEAKRLTGPELAQRRQEFSDMTKNLDLQAINRSKAKK